MNVLLETCLTELQEYHKLYKDLCHTLEAVIQLKPVEKFSCKFKPSKSSIGEEIKHYPKEEFLLPPAAWVNPRKGQIEYKNQTWEFAFHGGGLSFFDNQVPPKDISVEFSRDGDVALTAWTFRCYLESVSIQKNEPTYKDIVEQCVELLDELVELDYLVPVTPVLIMDDPTFVLVEK